MIGFGVARTAVCSAALIAFACLHIGCSSPPPDYEFFDACELQEVPDAECYASKRDPASTDVQLATDIAHRFIDEHPAAELEWNWEEAVLMYAMTELYRVTGDTAVRDYYRAWIDHHITEGYAIVWSDSCPPALAATALYIETGEEQYADINREVLSYLDEVAVRTEEGGISHLGALNVASIWVDSLFMFGMVLNRWGELTDDGDVLDIMGEQLDIFGTLLQADNGLLVHSHGWPLEFDTDIYWGRGNSWVTVAVADYVRARVLRHESDDRATEILSRQIDGAIATQDESGGWWSIMNRPDEIYLETSATALFAYGMARAYRYGFAGEEVRAPIDAALAYVRTQVIDDGEGRPMVIGTSGPTTVGTFDDYANVDLEDDLTYGVGGVILALIESSGLP